jgi:ABC-type sugar transport system substrate-binding protein
LTKTFVARANGFGMEVSTFGSQFDAALQAQQVDDAIVRKFDLIAVVAGSEQAIVQALIQIRRGCPRCARNAQAGR